MPLHVFWDDIEKTIIRCESEGKWTWDEYHKALDQVREMLVEADYRVDLINVERPGATMPSGSPLTHFQRAAKIMPANLGINVVVVTSSLARIMASVLGKMPGNNMDKIVLVDSVEAAYTLIQRNREKSLVRKRDES